MNRSSVARGPTRRRLFRRSGAVLCTLLTVACAPAGGGVTIEQAVLVLPIGGAPAAVYFTAHNRGAAPDTILGVAVDVASQTTMHTQQQHRMPSSGGSLALMTPVEAVPIASGEALRFSPGGFHAMVENFRRPIVRGDTVRATVRLSGGRATFSVAHVVTYDDLDSALAPTSTAQPMRAAFARAFAAVSGRTRNTAPAPSVAEGRTLYLANGCATCHGPTGQGDGPIGKTLDPQPRNFRDSAAFKNGTDPAAVAHTIAVGIAQGGAMPLFAHLTNDERLSLALYVTSLRHTTYERKSQP